MISIPLYRPSLRQEGELQLQRKDCGNFYSAKEIALAWFREMQPLGESLLVIGVNGKNEVVGVSEVGRGGLSGCGCAAGDIFRTALLMGASAFLLAHNHPSNDPIRTGKVESVLEAAPDIAVLRDLRG